MVMVIQWQSNEPPKATMGEGGEGKESVRGLSYPMIHNAPVSI